MVCIFLRGAMDGLSAVIPYAEEEYYRKRETIAIPSPKTGNSKTAFDLDGFFGLHPALQPLYEFWESKHLALVHAAGSPDPTHSHFEAWDLMETGTTSEKRQDSGWLVRHFQSKPSSKDNPLRAIAFDTTLPAVLRGPNPGVAIRSLEEFRLGGKNAPKEIKIYQNLVEKMYASSSNLKDEAAITLRIAGMLEKVAATTYTPSGGAKYPNGSYGQNLKQAAQIIKANLGMEAAIINLGGWDTHAQQGAAEGRLANLLTEFSTALAAFQKDLGDLSSRVTVLALSEFGRRVQENGSGGTDHGHGNVIWLLGKNIQGGKVYGSWPTLAAEKLYGPGDLAVTTDYRDVLVELMQKRLGNPNTATVFPGFSANSLGLFLTA